MRQVRIVKWTTALAVFGMLSLGLPQAWAEYGVQGGRITSGGTQTMSMTGFTASENAISTFPAGTLIYGFKVIATSATARCELYDGLTPAGPIIDDLSVNTTDTTQIQMWPFPYKIKTGLSIVIGDGNCIIYH